MQKEYKNVFYLCGESNSLCMIPHRNNDLLVVGIIFACDECHEKLCNRQLILKETLNDQTI